jgi:2-methylcitrate dehydratase PrpD
MTHALDYDDISSAMGGPPTAPLPLIILALGEQYHLAGKEALLAYAVGSEVEAKLGRCVNMVHYQKGLVCNGYALDIWPDSSDRAALEPQPRK